ncbi:XRE family transcriptional regulator [Streptomyces luteireticuli]|uniref:helix-turn-helix domain-containing protein n=1 Tax=Streptomyces luteireticuli TaxID=173858 RepID=UPI003557DCA2
MPEEVWDQNDVRDALASYDFGALCRLIRQHTGWGQLKLATILGVSQSLVSQWECGKSRVTDINKLDVLLHALGTPLAVFPLGPQTSTAGTNAGPVQPVDSLTEQAAEESLAFARLIAPGNVDESELDRLSTELCRIAIDYVHAPVRPLFKDLRKVRNRTFDLIHGQQHISHRERLFLLGGTACLLLAHASQNMGNEAAALAQLHTAWTCAEQIDHRGLQAWTRGTDALVAEWSPRRRRALALAQEADKLAPPGESRIRIAAIEARTAARLGDRDRALTALERMQDAQTQSPVEDELSDLGGILSFPPAKQHYYAGTVYSLLGDHEQAEHHASEALRRYASGPPEERSYGDEALALIDVITARLALGDLDSAGAHLQRILGLPPALRIRQLEDGLHRVDAMLQKPALVKSREAQQLTELTRGYEVISSVLPIAST